MAADGAPTFPAEGLATASGLAALQAMYLAPLELRGEPVHPPSSASYAADGDLAGPKFFAASAATNATLVADVLKTALAHPLLQQQRTQRPGQRNVVLEIGSGTGQHTVAVPTALPHVTWIPTDYLADTLPRFAGSRVAAALALAQCIPMAYRILRRLFGFTALHSTFERRPRTCRRAC